MGIFLAKRALPTLLMLIVSAPLFAQRRTGLRDYDRRDVPATAAGRPSSLQLRAQAALATRTAALQAFVAATPGVRIAANRYGLPKMMLRDGAALSDPAAGDTEGLARNFLRQHAAIFALSGSEVANLRVTLLDKGPGAAYIGFSQTIDGLDVFEASLKVTLNATGQVVQVSGGELVPGISVVTTPRLTPDEAQLRARAGNKTGSFLSKPELIIFPLDAISARLAWRLFYDADATHSYEILVDALDGSILYRHNNVAYAAAQGRVWKQSPITGTLDLVDFPASWLPDTVTVTTGNNADAFLDANGDDKPDTTPADGMQDGRALATAGVFDFPFGDGTTAADPRGFKASSVLNLFYLVNSAHDYYYSLGFNEAAGNFQTDNFGKGGKGGDGVVAMAQHGGEVDNASFTPTPEGTPGRVKVGLFTRNTATRIDDFDGDYDGQVLLHEYAHGVSNRLVGTLTSTSCLQRTQSGAMGEGWSDYFAISYYNNPVIGAYVTARPTRGIRRQGYDAYTFTYEDVGNQGYEVHKDGEIWAATLWDLRKSLGQRVTDRLVMDGLKGTPCNPSMTDARDAILSADQAANNGANRAIIWQIFAKHGMGFSARGIEGSPFSGTIYDAAFDSPADLQPVRAPAITSKPLGVQAGLGDPYNYTVAATNPAGGTLSYTLGAGPDGMSVNLGTGDVSWTGSFASPRVKIVVADGRGGRTVHGYMAPMLTRLTAGTPLSVSGPIDSMGFAYVEPPAGTPVLQIALRGGSGDPDLFVSDPTGGEYLSGRDGSNETLSFATPDAGRWLIEVDGYTAYSTVSLAATAITPLPLSPNAVLRGLGEIAGVERFYRIPVPAQSSVLRITTSGTTGDVDLYMNQGSPAVCQQDDSVDETCTYTVSSTNDGDSEAITILTPVAGDWYLDLTSFLDYSDVTLTTSLTVLRPDLTVLARHTGNFAQGQKGAAFSILVSNAGATPTIGAVTVADALPAGLSATALSGTDWTCTLATLTCSRADALEPGASYPVITLTADISRTAPASVTNAVTVAGGGQTAGDNDSSRDIALVGNGGPAPTVLTGGVAPVYSTSTTIQPGSWVSIYGTGFASGISVWNGDFPTTLGGVTVTINGKPAYLWFVSPTQINLQAPDDSVTGSVDVVITNGNGSVTAKVTLGQASPSFSLFPDGKHLAGVISRSGGAYEFVGPTNAFAFATRPVKAGEVLILYGVGFGPTVQPVPAGTVFSGAAAMQSEVVITIGGVKAQVLFAGLTGAGLYQFNIIVPAGLTPGDKSVQAVILSGGLTPVGPLLTVQ